MHEAIQKLLVRYLKFAKFDEIRTDFHITDSNGVLYKPDVYARKVIPREKRMLECIFKIVLSNLELSKVFGLANNINSKFFIVTYGDDFIEIADRLDKIPADAIIHYLKIFELRPILIQDNPRIKYNPLKHRR